MKYIYYLILIIIKYLLIINGEILNNLFKFECNQPLITLYIYSSQLNPTWKINLTNLIEINYLINQNNLILKQNTNRIMGYQGFLISCSLNNQLFIQGNILLENKLLNTGLSYLSFDIINHVKLYIGQIIINQYLFKKSFNINCNYVPIKGPDSVPIYNPLTDNGGCFITKQSKNNCYAYATDIVTNTFPQPGRYSGKSASSIKCEFVRNASLRDGLIYKGYVYPNDQPKIGHYLALFIWSNIDYHWIRKDANGYWSHKPGPGRVTNRDNRGSLIINPLKSNFSPWNIFCGFYIAQPSKVHIY